MKLATLCYVKKEGHTLMLHRIKKQNDMHQGVWNGLSGKLNPGESPEYRHPQLPRHKLDHLPPRNLGRIPQPEGKRI